VGTAFEVKTPQHNYQAIVERGILGRAADYLPAKSGKVFVITTADVWRHQGEALTRGLSGRPHDTLYLPGGEAQKRLAPVEALAEEMVHRGADRSSAIIAFGGGIVNDMAGFLAAIFMRGIPVLQIPTTLLAQVDAAIGGKTGVNLVAGKNLMGSFHQPVAVLIDPAALDTLPAREYHAGLFEVIKYGVIASPALFHLLSDRQSDVAARTPAVVDEIIAESVRIKAEVVSADEREGGIRKILNFGHTVGHALEAETAYSRFLHGEAVAFGMQAAVHLAESTRHLSAGDGATIRDTIRRYGPIPSLTGIAAARLLARLGADKKAVQGNVHFVLPRKIGEVTVVSGVADDLVRDAIQAALA
jgi:3-dehydroquinate synthase